MDNEDLDINHLNKWLGNTEIVTDYLTPIVEQRYRATLNIDPGDPKIGEPSTTGLHWMLGWNLKKNDELGVDSHPARGDFLPPVPLPRRMWDGIRENTDPTVAASAVVLVLVTISALTIYTIMTNHVRIQGSPEREENS